MPWFFFVGVWITLIVFALGGFVAGYYCGVNREQELYWESQGFKMIVADPFLVGRQKLYDVELERSDDR